MRCGRARYILHSEEGCFLCENPACRHQLMQMVESRVSCGTGYSNELCVLHSKNVILPVPARSRVLLACPSAPSAAPAAAPAAAQLMGVVQSVFACLPSAGGAASGGAAGSGGGSSQNHERLAHFRELLAPFRGPPRQSVPRHVVVAVARKLAERRVVLVQDLRFSMVRALLKDAGYSHYISRTCAVMYAMGHVFPYMTDETEELFCHLFQRIEQLWTMHSGGVRTVCFQYNYVLHQLCLHTGHPEFLPYLQQLKDLGKQSMYDEILQRVLRTLLAPSVLCDAGGTSGALERRGGGRAVAIAPHQREGLA